MLLTAPTIPPAPLPLLPTLLATLLHEGEPRRRSLRALQQALDCADIALAADEAAQLTDCNTETLWHEVNR